MRPIITTTSDDPIGLAVVRSLGKSSVDFQIVSTTKNTLAGYSRYCNQKIVGSYDLDFFSKLSKDDVVFPMLEDTMLLLAKNRSKLSCRMGFSDFETLQIITDKSLVVHHAIEHKIPCPKTFIITNSDDIRKCIPCIDFPMILKPGKGSGGKGILSVDSPILLPGIAEKFLKESGPFLLQEKIPYTTKYTIGALCNSEHELKRICVIKELRNHPFENGPACYVETVDEPRLVHMTEKLLKSLDFVGIADIDLVIDSRDKQPKLMEINPRFWGSTQVAINAGVDFPALLYTMLKDGDIKESLTYKTGVRCRYLLYNDLVRLITVLRSDCSSGYKRKTIRDFFKVHKSDGYYVYSHDDIMPFFGLAYIKLLRKCGLERKNQTD